MEKKTIGGFIAALRKANGMTQKDLAEKLNVSDKTVSRWERDDGAPDLSAIPVIAEIFGVTCDEIVAFGDDMADLGMLSVCGLGVAVANAVPEIKAVADVVCGSNEEDGVAHYINEFFL